MPGEMVKPEVIWGVMCVIGAGAIVLNRIGILKVSLGRNGNGKDHPISPEALSKIATIRRDLDEKYLTINKHADLCTITSLRLEAYITDQLKKHTREIIDAVNANRKIPK